MWVSSPVPLHQLPGLVDPLPLLVGKLFAHLQQVGRLEGGLPVEGKVGPAEGLGGDPGPVHLQGEVEHRVAPAGQVVGNLEGQGGLAQAGHRAQHEQAIEQPPVQAPVQRRESGGHPFGGDASDLLPGEQGRAVTEALPGGAPLFPTLQLGFGHVHRSLKQQHCYLFHATTDTG